MQVPGHPRVQADLVVIGGGIIGCAIAYHLALAGIDVILVERGELNREASGSSAGNLHIQVDQKMKYDDLGVRQERRAIADLHRIAGELWQGLEAELNADLGVRVRGGLMVAESAEDLARLKAKSAFERSVGIESGVISKREMLDIEPALSDVLVGANWCPVEGFANPLVVGPTYARRAAEAGARIRVWSEVTAIESGSNGGFTVHTTTGKVDARRIVNAAGAWASRIASMVGVKLPVGGEVLQVNVTEPWRPTMTTMVQHVSRTLTLKQTQYGTFLIGGGWPGELGDDEVKIATLSSLTGNVWTAARIMPLLNRVSILRSWAGMSPTIQGRSLIVGECGKRGFYVAVPGATGFTLAPIVARMVTELITSGQSGSLFEHFNAGRLVS